MASYKHTGSWGKVSVDEGATVARINVNLITSAVMNREQMMGLQETLHHARMVIELNIKANARGPQPSSKAVEALANDGEQAAEQKGE